MKLSDLKIDSALAAYANSLQGTFVANGGGIFLQTAPSPIPWPTFISPETEVAAIAIEDEFTACIRAIRYQVKQRKIDDRKAFRKFVEKKCPKNSNRI